MKLVIGLGNPEGKYENNRHNVGHLFVNWVKKDSSSERTVLREELFFFLKTNCFMNESGKCVRQELRKVGVKDYSQLYVVHDDLDLPLGKYKIQFGVGPKVHYGLQSIENELGSKDFWRIRIGVDARDPLKRTSGDRYVLEDFKAEEKTTLKGVFDAILEDDSFPR